MKKAIFSKLTPALTVSIAAIAISVAGVWISYNGVIQAQKSYQQAAEQFQKSGPQLEITAKAIKVWNSETLEWTNVPPGTSIAYEQMASPNMANFIFDVVNSGRSTARVSEGGIRTSKTTTLRTTALECVNSDEMMILCTLPIVLEPGATQHLMLSLDRFDRASLTCNQYIAEHGLDLVVIRTDGVETVKPTGIGEAYATYCPNVGSTGTRVPTRAGD